MVASVVGPRLTPSRLGLTKEAIVLFRQGAPRAAPAPLTRALLLTVLQDKRSRTRAAASRAVRFGFCHYLTVRYLSRLPPPREVLEECRDSSSPRSPPSTRHLEITFEKRRDASVGYLLSSPSTTCLRGYKVASMFWSAVWVRLTRQPEPLRPRSASRTIGVIEQESARSVRALRRSTPCPRRHHGRVPRPHRSCTRRMPAQH